MKHSPLFLLILLMTAAVAVASTAPAGISAAALRFDRMPLGNVARVLSARFRTTVTIMANAAAPITGDFSSLNLPQALREATTQAGLVVRPSGPGAAAGYTLALPTATAEGPLPAQAARDAAQERREQLLKQRAVLLDQATRLEH